METAETAETADTIVYDDKMVSVVSALSAFPCFRPGVPGVISEAFAQEKFPGGGHLDIVNAGSTVGRNYWKSIGEHIFQGFTE